MKINIFGLKMTRTFISTYIFIKMWEAMGLGDDDLRKLESALLEDSQIGDVIKGTGGARKVRIQLNGKGKSGGGRVIYIDIFEKEKIYLLLAYPKNKQEDLTPEQIKILKKHIDEIKGEQK